MLGSFFTKYVFDKFTELEHPIVDISSCINCKQKKMKCTVCKDICTEGVYDKTVKNPDWDKCGNCNLCVSACPSRSIGSSTSNLEKFFKAVDENGDILSISCDNSSKKSSLKVECIAALPWEFLLYILMKKKIIINSKECFNCDNKECIALIQENLSKILNIIGEEKFNNRVFFNVHMEEIEVKKYSRRELIGLVVENSKKSAAKLIPKFVEEDYSTGLLYRFVLNKEIVRNNHEAYGDSIKSLKWNVPFFSEKCWGCGICIKICPQQALSLNEEDENVYISMQPLKCNNCGVCSVVCLDKAIEGQGYVEIKNLMPIRIVDLKVNKCSRCNRIIKVDEKNNICVGCRQLHK